jgi:hypothetical protein
MKYVCQDCGESEWDEDGFCKPCARGRIVNGYAHLAKLDHITREAEAARQPAVVPAGHGHHQLAAPRVLQLLPVRQRKLVVERIKTPNVTCAAKA